GGRRGRSRARQRPMSIPEPCEAYATLARCRVAEQLVAELTAAAGAPVDASPQWQGQADGSWSANGGSIRSNTSRPAAKDDRWPPCRLEFGSPVTAVITTRDGHPIFWIWRAPELAARWHESLRRIASQRLAIETSLRRSCLRG